MQIMYTGCLTAATWREWGRYFSPAFRVQALNHADEHAPADRIRTRFDCLPVRFVPLVPLPALSGCPWCGMTNVVRTADPVMVCSWCGDDYFPVGVLTTEDVDAEVVS